MPRLAVVALLAVAASHANAQRAASAVSHASRSATHTFSFSSRPDAAATPRHRAFLYPPLFYSDPFYSDALFSTGYPVASEPPVIVVQAASTGSTPQPPNSPTQALLIELQGDRYVRVSGEESAGSQLIDSQPPSSSARRSQSDSAAQVATTDLPPVHLVFRDCHREEVTAYTIADGILYAHTDYYTDGSWNKKINLKALDLPETVRANLTRGVRFQVPSSPNEVITRP